jgi:chaperone LolA
MRLFAFVLAFAQLTHGTHAAELSSTETAELVERMKEHRAKFPSLTADFTEEKTSRLLRKPLITSGSIAFTSPNLFRREVKGANPSTTVCDGRELWIYYPNFKEAEHYVLGQHRFFDDSIAALTAGLNFESIGQHYRYTAHRDENGFRLQLSPKSGSLKRLMQQFTVWITEDFLISRTETLMPKGDRAVTTYRNQRPTDVPRSTFAFRPPADAKVSTPLGK